jgi:drug/metabolite transporter (DMT)-like permease
MVKQQVDSAKSRAILLALLSAFFYSLMMVFVRMSGDVSNFQKLLLRNIIMLLLSLCFALRRPKELVIQKRNRPLLLLRSVLGTIAVLSGFYALNYLIVSDATILYMLSPLCAVLFSALFLKEKTTIKQRLLMTVALCGTLLVIKPSMNYLALLPMIAGVSSGVLTGMTYTFVRKLQLGGEESQVLVFWYSLLSVQ